MALGLHQVAGFYYYPGFHEPGSGFSVGINKGLWESFEASDRRVIEAVAACAEDRSTIRWGAIDLDSSRPRAAEIMMRTPDVATTSATMEAALQTTGTVPIVFVNIIDPVSAG